MKFFVFIMAFLVLALPVMPCADDAENADASKIKTEIAKQNSHREEQEHNDSCSPFCHCSCCAGFSINHVFVASSLPILFDNKPYTSCLQGSIIKASYTIWQPPKIS